MSLSAILSAAITIPTMILLYHKWIIPRVIKGVKEELPPAVISIVDEKISAFFESLQLYIDDKITSVKMSTLGQKGAKARIVSLALDYLDKNGVNGDTLGHIVEKYGQGALDEIAKMSQKPQGERENNGIIPG